MRISSRSAASILAVLKAAETAAFLAGAGLLAWVAFVLFDSAYTQWDGARVLAAERRDARETIVPHSEATAALHRTAARKGSVVGMFEMPRLGLSFVVLEGTDNRTLDKSIGRVLDSAALGSTGNIGIAGHRNTHFRKLEWVQRDDEILVTSHNKVFRYRVEWVRLFQPDDLQVLDSSHGPAVTLITCFPFEFVGSAPLRYVVRALPDEATRAKLMAAALPTQGKE